jgi:hypothetical protein
VSCSQLRADVHRNDQKQQAVAITAKRQKADDSAVVDHSDAPTTTNRFVAAALGITLKRPQGTALPSKAEVDRLAEWRKLT